MCDVTTFPLVRVCIGPGDEEVIESRCSASALCTPPVEVVVGLLWFDTDVREDDTMRPEELSRRVVLRLEEDCRGDDSLVAFWNVKGDMGEPELEGWSALLLSARWGAKPSNEEEDSSTDAGCFGSSEESTTGLVTGTLS